MLCIFVAFFTALIFMLADCAPGLRGEDGELGPPVCLATNVLWYRLAGFMLPGCAALCSSMNSSTLCRTSPPF